ncbi:cobalamin biosynthesis protein [Rhodovibrio sodomensis]|uniref:cobalamin biosynthesis protein n=1 Tax=Rhodovibrio sodomensis TaxID=1088 RepID=UPI001903D218
MPALTGRAGRGTVASVMTTPLGAYGANDPLFLLLAALIVEAYVGDVIARLPRVPHPRALLARLTARLERRLNRPQRGRQALVLRGLTVVLALALAAAAIGWGLAALSRVYPFAWVVELFLLVALIGQHGALRGLKAVADALAAGGAERTRAALRPMAGERLTPEQLEGLDLRGLSIAALDGGARRSVSAAFAPVLFYVLLGLPGLMAQQAIWVVACVVANGNKPGGQGLGVGREGDFALAAVTLDAALVWVPDKVAGLLFALAAAFVPGAHPLTALKRLSKAHAWSVGALGGALRLTGRKDGTLSRVGAPEATQLKRAAMLLGVALLIQGGLVAVLVLLRQAT